MAVRDLCACPFFGLVDLGWNGQALQEPTRNSSSLVVYLPSATLLLQGRRYFLGPGFDDAFAPFALPPNTN